jgi:broad specificity phosphatase PhoE
LSRVYLVRHGQAGTRKAYDALSDLGRRQARLLGEYFVSEGIRFAAAYRGELKRQAQTAEEVRAAYCEAGACFQEVAVQSGWNEFDLAISIGHWRRVCATRIRSSKKNIGRW